jgi:hypothetical protein
MAPVITRLTAWTSGTSRRTGPPHAPARQRRLWPSWEPRSATQVVGVAQEAAGTVRARSRASEGPRHWAGKPANGPDEHPCRPGPASPARGWTLPGGASRRYDEYADRDIHDRAIRARIRRAARSPRPPSPRGGGRGLGEAPAANPGRRPQTRTSPDRVPLPIRACARTEIAPHREKPRSIMARIATTTSIDNPIE